MSGFFGFCSRENKTDLEFIIQKMLQASAMRGRDASWYSVDEYMPGECLILGETVLKTMPDAAYQCVPMRTPDQKYGLVYDGEVYNYREIRKELEDEFQFKSDSDAEVVLYALVKWGMKALTKFNGFFSICFADLQNGKLYLIRDRGGIRPLYIYSKGGAFIFASRLQAIQEHPCFVPEIDEAALAYYFRYSFVPEPFCVFQNCTKIRPGHYAEIDLHTGQMTTSQYWDLIDFFAMPKLDISYREAQEKLENLFLSSCEYRCQGSHLPGSLLSGGYDSGGIAAFLAHLHPQSSTYTIGFLDGVDEAPDAARIANHLQTNHHQKYCSAEDACNIIAQLPDIYDEPFGDSSAIPTTLAAKLAASTSKVIFSADAGDETFGGYDIYRTTLPFLNLTKRFPSNFAGIAAKFLEALSCLPFPRGKKHALEYLSTCFAEKIPPFHPIFLRHELSNLLFRPSEVKLNFAEKRMHDLSGMLFRDFHIGLAGDSFVKVDRAVTSAGIQYREPVMDHRITEFAAQLPDSFKINMKGGKKIIYKDLVHKYIPKELMERPKHGFSIPITQWLGSELRPIIDEALSPKNVKDIPCIKTDGVTQVYMRYKENPTNVCWALQVWYVFCFVNWFNQRIR